MRATTTRASVFAPREMVKAPAMGQDWASTDRSRMESRSRDGRRRGRLPPDNGVYVGRHQVSFWDWRHAGSDSPREPGTVPVLAGRVRLILCNARFIEIVKRRDCAIELAAFCDGGACFRPTLLAIGGEDQHMGFLQRAELRIGAHDGVAQQCIDAAAFR